MLPLGTFTRLLNRAPRLVQTTITSLLCNLKIMCKFCRRKTDVITENERQLKKTEAKSL